MSEEVKQNNSNFYVVCAACFHHEHNASIEINFRDSCIYYICPKCNHVNQMKLVPQGKPLPKIKIM